MPQKYTAQSPFFMGVFPLFVNVIRALKVKGEARLSTTLYRMSTLEAMLSISVWLRESTTSVNKKNDIDILRALLLLMFQEIRESYAIWQKII